MGNSVVTCNCASNTYTENYQDSIEGYTTDRKVKSDKLELKNYNAKRESLVIFDKINIDNKVTISREEFEIKLTSTVKAIFLRKKQEVDVTESDISYYMNPIKINDEYYDGQWNIQGERHGVGLFIDENGSVYYGDWELDAKQGKGLYINQRGDYYIGDWEKGQMSGIGELSLSEGLIYMGEFKYGIRDGKGVEIAKDYIYYGEFINNVKEGFGTLKTSELTYKGYFTNNNYNGHGLITWSDGRQFAGVLDNAKINGIGIMIYSNGNKYIGHYENAKKKGKGIYYWEKCKYYNGEWLNNKPHGSGEYHSNNRYKGHWRFGKPIFMSNNILS